MSATIHLLSTFDVTSILDCGDGWFAGVPKSSLHALYCSNTSPPNTRCLNQTTTFHTISFEERTMIFMFNYPLGDQKPLVWPQFTFRSSLQVSFDPSALSLCSLCHSHELPRCSKTWANHLDQNDTSLPGAGLNTRQCANTYCMASHAFLGP